MPDGTAPHYVHGTALVIGEAGVLIRGRSGSGKSSLTLRLIAEASRRGTFARLVGDDRVALAAANGAVVARPHPTIAGRLERRTLPIATMPHEMACVLRLVVDLLPAPLPRLPDLAAAKIRLEDIDLPVLRVAAGSADLSCLFIFQELARL
jgi:HPr kinase/phosphorylase